MTVYTRHMVMVHRLGHRRAQQCLSGDLVEGEFNFSVTWVQVVIRSHSFVLFLIRTRARFTSPRQFYTPAASPNPGATSCPRHRPSCAPALTSAAVSRCARPLLPYLARRHVAPTSNPKSAARLPPRIAYLQPSCRSSPPAHSLLRQLHILLDSCPIIRVVLLLAARSSPLLRRAPESISKSSNKHDWTNWVIPYCPQWLSFGQLDPFR